MGFPVRNKRPKLNSNIYLTSRVITQEVYKKSKLEAGTLAGGPSTATWQEGNLDYDSELERTLLRRRREARKRARQAALEQQLNMAAEHRDDNLNLENNQNRVTLGQYINPTADSCGSTIRRPAIQANSFELKPSLIQLVQQD
ncbi:hypothetical protein PIB30_023305 [Stylosanthes scabra]|uniref:Uncharacterized protein n=1 Tax=Stylosanthes scabra TaxID=79078 RepID=A0ABU6R9R5_9FABA|nr:hypothetical protein [Stylosanthes scabra]